MNFSKTAIIAGLIGISVAFIGFLFSDETKYPVASKFSGVMIILGVLTFGFAVSTKYNPVPA